MEKQVLMDPLAAVECPIDTGLTSTAGSIDHGGNVSFCVISCVNNLHDCIAFTPTFSNMCRKYRIGK